MAKLTATKVKLATGKHLISGYKVALPKTEMEKCGFKAGDELSITYRKGEVRISHK